MKNAHLPYYVEQARYSSFVPLILGSVQSTPDLRIAGVFISLDPSVWNGVCVPSSASLDLYTFVVVENIGTASSGRFGVKIRCYGLCYGAREALQYVDNGLVAGGTVRVQFQDKFLDAEVEVDPDNMVSESNENNNMLRVRVPIPTPPPHCPPTPTPTRP